MPPFLAVEAYDSQTLNLIFHAPCPLVFFCCSQYHYYRASFVYNEIRVFVSAYVWMTGFGNFLYFTKKQDFSIDRALSMWLRINYFPLLLVLIVGTKLDDFYIVPLHTTGFFITMATCYAAKLLEPLCKERKNAVAILLCVLVHIIFYETPLVDTLKLFSDEIHFRFQADKYSAVIGIVCGFFWANFKQALQFYNTDTVNTNQRIASACQIALGCLFIIFWYTQFGHIQDKYIYNPFHPYIFWIPVAGWLLIRNSSKYLMECHSTVLEFFGRITLETYVLQFHLLMCHHVRHIPVVIPGSDADGTWFMKLLNMLFCGVIFVTTAYWARQHTVTTQTTITDLMGLVKSYILEGKIPTAPDLDEGVKELDPEQGKPEEETVPLNPETPTEAQHRHKFASNEV